MKRSVRLCRLLAAAVCLTSWLTAKTQSELPDAKNVAESLGGVYAIAKVLVIPEGEYLHLLVSENGTEVNKTIYVQQPKDFPETNRKVLEKAQVLNLPGVVVINSLEGRFRYIFRIRSGKGAEVFGNLPASYFSDATVIDPVGIGCAPIWRPGAASNLAIPVEKFKPGVNVFSLTQ